MIARMRKVLMRDNQPVGWSRFLLKGFMLAFGILALLSLSGCKEHFLGILNPKGLIAYEERKLLFDTLALMLIVVLPVIVMSITFIYHYQVSHRIRDYQPNWSHNYFLESLWWGIPCVITVILAAITWRATHELDPFRRIPGTTEEPLLVQVIALPWKWLFIYPKEDIATVNLLVVPVGRQVEYWLTTDNVPMSAFFIPQLGSQIYAMAGMRSRLHLIASEVGIFNGLNTQYNGDGFSDMHFPVYSIDPMQMKQWVAQMKKAPNALTPEAYKKLLNESIGDKPQFFSGVAPDLFNQVIMTYLHTFGPVHPRNNSAKLIEE